MSFENTAFLSTAITKATVNLGAVLAAAIIGNIPALLFALISSVALYLCHQVTANNKYGDGRLEFLAQGIDFLGMVLWFVAFYFIAFPIG